MIYLMVQIIVVKKKSFEENKNIFLSRYSLVKLVLVNL